MNQFNVSLWGDEAFSAILSMKSVPEIIKIIIRDTSPPLYNITEHIWFGVFGTSEVAIRSLSFLYFLLSGVFIYLIASFLWNKKTGLLALALSLLNPFYFTYAFEGRMYSILSLGVCASMYFFIRLFYWEGKAWAKWLIGGYVFSTAWALYSHHFAIFILSVQGILWFWLLIKKEWTNVKNVFVGFLLGGVFYIPWLLPLYRQTKMVQGGFWLGRPNTHDLINLIFKYLAEGISHPLSKAALLFVFAVLLMRKWNKKMEKSAIVLLWFLGPILITWGLSQKLQSIFFDRYLLYTIPAAMILLASGGRKRGSAVSIAILLGLFITIDWWYFTHPIKPPFRDLAGYVREEVRGDDYLINWNSSSHHLWEAKYYGIPAPLYIPKGSGDLPFFVGTALMTQGDIVSIIPKKVNRVGVITSGSVDEVSVPGYSEVSYREFGSLKFIWLQK